MPPSSSRAFSRATVEPTERLGVFERFVDEYELVRQNVLDILSKRGPFQFATTLSDEAQFLLRKAVSKNSSVHGAFTVPPANFFRDHVDHFV